MITDSGNYPNWWYDSSSPAWSPAGTKLAFDQTRCGSDPIGFCDGANVAVANPDGSGQENLTVSQGGSSHSDPAWSPDGTRIAFGSTRDDPGPGLYVMNADGSNETRLVDDRSPSSPAWSPDGSKIAYVGNEPGDRPDIFVIPAAGGTPQRLTNDIEPASSPDWSPDGSRIVWETNHNIYVMNANGSGQTRILYGHSNLDPAWSPEGDKIVFRRAICPPGAGCGSYDLYTMNPDGTGVVKLYGDDAKDEAEPAWQSLPINAYPRPAGATNVYVALVPAYPACDPGAATLSHGPPLAYQACASPSLESGHLTFGTGDVNGQAANSRGHVKLTQHGETPVTTTNGDQADVFYRLELRDVRNAADVTDYAGELQAQIPLRITDRDNTPTPIPNGAATVSDTALSFPAPCAATSSAGIGATCAVSTSADSLVPGTVKEGRRAVWELDKVLVFDGGSDGDADTEPNSLLATQGVFVP